MSQNKKEIVSISMDRETRERLNEFVKEKHTSVSQAITDWIWSVKLNKEK